MNQLLRNIPAAEEDRQPNDQAVWILAHVLDWHRREDKVVWWEFFRLADLDADELLDERAALSGLVFVDRVGGTLRAPIDRYSFPPQETDIRGGEDLRVLGGGKLGKVDAISLDDCTVDIKKMVATANLHPVAIFAHTKIQSDDLAASLFRVGEWVAEHGMEEQGAFWPPAIFYCITYLALAERRLRKIRDSSGSGSPDCAVLGGRRLPNSRTAGVR